jgi:DNA-binding transcriptional MerR regulator
MTSPSAPAAGPALSSLTVGSFTFPHWHGYCAAVCIICIFDTSAMTKPLTQITFEFNGTGGEVAPAMHDTLIMEPEVKQKLQPPPPSRIINTDIKKKSSTRGRKSLKDITLASDLINIPEDEILFKKQYYAIGEVATMFRENQSLIRYWETEFDILQPRKNRKGDRFFRPVDIKNLVMIYDLLRRRKFTIEGAKDYLKKNKNAEEKFAVIQSLEKIKQFFLELKASL